MDLLVLWDAPEPRVPARGSPAVVGSAPGLTPHPRGSLGPSRRPTPDDRAAPRERDLGRDSPGIPAWPGLGDRPSPCPGVVASLNRRNDVVRDGAGKSPDTIHVEQAVGKS